MVDYSHLPEILDGYFERGGVDNSDADEVLLLGDKWGLLDPDSPLRRRMARDAGITP